LGLPNGNSSPTIIERGNSMSALWAPSQEQIAETNLFSFMKQAEERGFGPFADYDSLWDWSVTDLDNFWSLVWDFGGVIGHKGTTILANSEDLQKADFFPDARVNYAENMLRGSGKTRAMVFVGENGDRSEWTWADLRGRVSVLQQELRARGVVAGDRVAGFVPNTPDTLAAMLATASLGAVWSSCSPDFGYNGVFDRFAQIEPKVLFCADAYYYNGKEFDCIATAGQLAAAIPSVVTVIVQPLVDQTPDMEPLGPKGQIIDTLLQNYDVKPVEFTPMPFNAPLYIMFSSGTTGLPKCIVHSTGGVLIQHLKEHQLQADVRAGDRVLYFTTCGWMMWNWMVSGLAAGAELVLFDGSPFYPDGNRLADIVAAEQVTHFGTSAKYIDACLKADVKPRETHDLTALRGMLSTGSPLAADGFDYVYRDWKTDICLSSIAGGTDIIGCFVGGSPISPVYRGECQKRHLGMKVEVFDDTGTPTQGEQGELVCTAPHPTQPIGFWNDDDGQRYFSAYYARFENVWHQGDFVKLTDHGGVKFYGRSDAVLNPGGVRIGTAEIYRQVERIDAVLEGLVIGQNWDNDVRVVLFVRLREGVSLDEALIKQIKTEIRTNATPRHVPSKIIHVSDIPRTKSGKITELAVRDIVHGRVVKNTEALANPEALDLFKDLPDLAV
jgi:acetoacetyl-CoA synthetase